MKQSESSQTGKLMDILLLCQGSSLGIWLVSYVDTMANFNNNLSGIAAMISFHLDNPNNSTSGYDQVINI